MLENRINLYEMYKDDQEALKQQKYGMPADYKEEYVWLREVDSLALRMHSSI
jgi:putative transposase